MLKMYIACTYAFGLYFLRMKCKKCKMKPLKYYQIKGNNQAINVGISKVNIILAYAYTVYYFYEVWLL